MSVEGNGAVEAEAAVIATPPVSPKARKLAAELGVDLGSVTGSGPRGRVVAADVEAAARATDGGGASSSAAVAAPVAPASSAPSAPDGVKGEVVVTAPSRVQQVVARRMAEAKATVPDFALVVEVAMDRCLGLRAELQALPDGPAPSLNDMVVKASALALRDHPTANGAYRDGSFERYSRVNVGIAVASADALVVPTVFDADRKSLREIAQETRALAERVRHGAITPPELAGGTFTVSNLGMFGVRRFTAVVNPPQAAILAVGATVRRPRERDGAVAMCSVMDLTLSCDHRILYGADAARFVARIRELLEQPLSLLS